MAIEKVDISNFKRFSSNDFDVSSPINLLVGTNSSGKSSFIKSILAMKQTFSSNNESEAFAALGEHVDLGVYENYVMDGDVTKGFSLGYTFKNDDPNGFSIFWPESIESQNLFSFKVIFNYSYDRPTEQARLDGIEIVLEGDFPGKSYKIILEKKKTRSSYWLYVSNDLHSEILNTLEKVFPVSGEALVSFSYEKSKSAVSVNIRDNLTFQLSESSYKSPNRFYVYSLEEMFKHVFNKVSQEFERGVFYLAPLRSSPSRSYKRTSHSLAVGVNGAFAPSVLANLKSKKTKASKRRFSLLQEWVGLIFPGLSVDCRTIQELVRVVVKKSNGGQENFVSDVGFGFSQVFPILVQTSVLPKGSMLIVEQPELHLHPKAQVAFSRFLVEAAKEAGVRFIVETHSEHIVKGLQLAVSEHRLDGDIGLSPEDVNIIYFSEPPEDPFTISLNSYGELDQEWPKGFFDSSYDMAKKMIINKGKKG